MATRRELTRLVRETLPLIGLADWRVDIQFPTDVEWAADCTAQPEYRTAIIRFNPRKIKDHEAVAFVCHELAHAHTWKLACLAELWAGQNKARQEAVRKAEEDLTTAWEVVMTQFVYRILTGKPCPPFVRVAKPAA